MSTYEPIASQTVSTATTTITFSSLPQNYTDLVLVISGQVSTASSFSMRINNDSGSNYSGTVIYTDGISALGSVRSTNQTQIDYGTTNGIGITGSGVYTPITVNIMNYANGTTFKTIIGTNRTTSGGYLGNGDITQSVNLYRSTNPITSISVFPSNSANWTTGSTFTIYGVAAGNSSAKASGGNIVTTDGSYWYHAFTSSGVFIPNSAISADVLCIAGGGSGGGMIGGGGGAGGLRYFTSQSLTANATYSAIIGAGGAGVNDVIGTTGNNGNNSQFGSLTVSTGGGAGAGYTNTLQNGIAGGSGGGGSGADSVFGAGGAASPSGQGNAGGAGVAGTNPWRSGGGGGAGSVGFTAGDGTSPGKGGAGVNTYSTFASATSTGVSGYYAAGGGGGRLATTVGGDAGDFGAGAGARNGATQAGSGTRNTGSGGGGGHYQNALISGSGGSGIVIIRYAV